MPRHVLILHRAMGSGISRAAQAVELTLREIDPAAHVENVDVLQLPHASLLNEIAQRALAHVQAAPDKVAHVFAQLDKPVNERVLSPEDRERIEQGNQRRLRAREELLKSLLPLIQSKPWDIVVNIDTITGWLIAPLKQQKLLTAPNVLVTTDFLTNRSEVGGYAHYFTATDDGAVYLCAQEIKSKRISVTGIPIHPDFCKEKNRQHCLQMHGLSGEKPIILQMAGGLGMGSAEQVYSGLLEMGIPVEIVMVAGKNTALKQRLEQIPVPKRHRAKILGFIDKIDTLMRVADVVVTKPGGLTVAEVLACGAAMIVVDPLPGMEMQNSDFLLENDAAIKMQYPALLPHILSRLLNDKKRLAAMKNNARRLGRPNAAFDIARRILGMIDKKRSKAGKREKGAHI